MFSERYHADPAFIRKTEPRPESGQLWSRPNRCLEANVPTQLKGVLEKAGDAFGTPSNQVEEDRLQFREYIEQKFKERRSNDGADVGDRGQF
jgi:hypothetical protein